VMLDINNCESSNINLCSIGCPEFNYCYDCQTYFFNDWDTGVCSTCGENCKECVDEENC